SIVADSQGLTAADPTRTSVAQRAYAVAGESGEAEFLYDEASFPGYGWIFPSHAGQVNLGVGLLAEARARADVHVPALFTRFVEQLRRKHPRCHDLARASEPTGG